MSSSSAASPVTQLLVQMEPGDTEAMHELLPLVYDELRRLAQHLLRDERANHTLNATALVHEAYVKLVDQDRADWQCRAQFFAVAAQAMRRILTSYARARNAQKRGGGAPKLSLDAARVVPDERVEEVLAIDDALDRLAELDERQARVVECRYFGGLTIDETARALGVSPATVKRDWNMARLWLKRAMTE